MDLVAPLFDSYRQFYACTANLSVAGLSSPSDSIVANRSSFWRCLMGKRVGFTQLYPTFTSIGLARAWILNDLYVSPEARRQGVGRQLMEAARQMATEMDAAWIELATAKDNDRAQAFTGVAGTGRTRCTIDSN